MAGQKEFYGVGFRVWLTLVLVSSVSAVLILPYALELAGQAIPPLPQFLFIALAAFIQNGVLFALVAYLGLRISKKIGLEPAPVLSEKTTFRKILNLSVLAGLAAGLGIVLLDLLLNSVFAFSLKAGVPPGSGAPGALPGFLASFYGGTAEELLLRLFFVPFCCLLITGTLRVAGRAGTWEHTNAAMWAAILIAAVVFGLGHLPATALIMDITPAVVARAVLLNGAGGVVFGWLFWKKGIESAMVAHFSADIVLHVLMPLLNYAI